VSTAGVLRHVRRSLASVLFLLALATPARAFPGVCVGRGGASCLVHTTHVVVLRDRGTTVVTVMADYEGPITPFLFVLPVPSDVTAERVQTVKRGIVGRLEQISAPRLLTFYEQDPCRPGPAEQAWEERILAHGRGFLTPGWVPPLSSADREPEEPKVSKDPVLKGVESEFRYQVLSVPGPSELARALRERGYPLSQAGLDALGPSLRAGRGLLLAEVMPDRAELLGDRRLQLGGVRYWSRQPLTTLPVRLGLLNARGRQDLFVYVLDREHRYQARDYENRIPPSNLEIDPERMPGVGPLYDALFERIRARSPRAFVTEFAWSTAGCGEPCPDEPLQPRELLSLGGDVVASEGTEEEKPSYVLSRLHSRYDAASLPHDVELAPAERALRAGVGIPKGPSAELSHGAGPAARDQIQVRFVAVRPWEGAIPCPTPERFRWGKPWRGEPRPVSRTAFGLDLSRAPHDPTLLGPALLTPLPELGLTEPGTPAPSALSPAGAPHRHPAGPAPARDGCLSLSPGSAPGAGGTSLVWVAGWAFFGLLRARRRRRAGAEGRATGAPR
jgi:hypothetical protein